MNDRQRGREGELIFQRLMEKRGIGYKDLSANPAFWHKDIDAEITNNKNGHKKYVEIKTDYLIHKTKNLFYETDNIYSKNGYGWTKFCVADFLAYIDYKNRICYVFDWFPLKTYVEKNLEKFREIQIKGTKGKLIPLEKIMLFKRSILKY